MLKPCSTNNFHKLKDYTTPLQKKNRQQKIKCGIQIIHDRGNHWIASTIDSDQSVQVDDSVYSTVHAKTIDVINNIFVITDETKIDLKKMQIQKGSQDWVICHCNSNSITEWFRHVTNNIPPRRYEISCFTTKLLSPFPTTNK